MCSHPALLHPVVTMGPFSKWAIDYMTINPPSSNGHHYIIVAVGYFTKWAEAMPTFNNMTKNAAYFLFKHVITRFSVPQEMVIDNESHFWNSFMDELTTNLGLWQYFSSPYYPQCNGQVEAIKKVLRTMLQQTVNKNKTNWHMMLFSFFGITVPQLKQRLVSLLSNWFMEKKLCF